MYWPGENNTLIGVEYVRGPQGPGDCFVVRLGNGKVSYIGSFESERTAMTHLFEDESGVIHLCEGSQIHRGVYLVWTLCERDVPAGKSFKANESATCMECKKKAKVL